jgi:hypothetical protein
MCVRSDKAIGSPLSAKHGRLTAYNHPMKDFRQLILARDLGFLSHASYENLQTDVGEIKRMLASLLKMLRADR